MKNFFSVLFIILVLGLSFYFLKLKPTSDPELAGLKFFELNEVLPTDVIVKITNDGFVPAEISIQKGARVVFVNESSDWAWPASDPHPVHTDDPFFDPKEPFKNDEAWAFIFDKTGNWGYHDHLFSGHRGEVIVK